MGTKMERLLQFAQPRLEDGEYVRATVSGSCDAKVDGDGVRTALLVATDRRVIVLSKKLSGCTLTSVRYDEVSSLEQGKNLMGHSLAFRGHDHNVTLKWIVDLADLAEFAAFVKSQISGCRGTSADPSAIADQGALHQLDELRDSVGLTADEFESARAELLARN